MGSWFHPHLASEDPMRQGSPLALADPTADALPSAPPEELFRISIRAYG